MCNNEKKQEESGAPVQIRRTLGRKSRQASSFEFHAPTFLVLPLDLQTVLNRLEATQSQRMLVIDFSASSVPFALVHRHTHWPGQGHW
jgi:hypothetical protein